jgi:hypothetical protein
MKFRIVMGKTALHKKQTLSTNKPEFNLRKKLVKCYIWGAAVYGAGSRTLRKVTKNTVEVLKCGAGEGQRSIGQIV